MAEKLTFDVWCLINPDYRQIVKRVFHSSRPDLPKTQVVQDINTHINANKPLLLGKGKKLRFWKSLNPKPPWANEVYLYLAGLGPDSETSYCETHTLHHNKDQACPLCDS